VVVARIVIMYFYHCPNNSNWRSTWPNLQ